LQLLSGPLARKRITGLTAALDATSMAFSPLTAAIGTASQHSAGGEFAGERACSMALSFVQAACVAVPLLLLAWLEGSAPPRQPGGSQRGAYGWMVAGWRAAVAGVHAASQRTRLECASLLWSACAMAWLLIKTFAA
jgi:hypothetical protein